MAHGVPGSSSSAIAQLSIRQEDAWWPTGQPSLHDHLPETFACLITLCTVPVDADTLRESCSTRSLEANLPAILLHKILGGQPSVVVASHMLWIRHTSNACNEKGDEFRLAAARPMLVGAQRSTILSSGRARIHLPVWYELDKRSASKVFRDISSAMASEGLAW
mmetsp:Transcript_23430/g.48764  ORF Transcript_23430/g.48764 Transcript_23430/m.48764 type:complete len:164 (-) Transcript_23430:593-1084(-)